jgi:hypothetical protein
MIRIVPAVVLALDYRVYHLRTIPTSGHVLACSREGQCSLVAHESSSPRSFHLPTAPKSIALGPAADLFGVAGHEGLQILDLLKKTPVTSFGAFEALAFSPDGEFLWSVRRLDSDLVSVEVRDRQTWRMVSQTHLHDPFGQSSFDLCFHPRGQHVALWAAAGQDGQAIFFARADRAAVQITRLENVNDTTPPSFSLNGDEFLISVAGSSELRLYSFPESALLGTVRCPENEASGDYAQFAGDERALLQWGEGQLYLVDLRSHAIVDEVVISGHEPRSISELYPTLKDDPGIGSDLYFFQPYRPGTFISVHQRLPQSEDGWKSLVLTWQLPDAVANGQTN